MSTSLSYERHNVVSFVKSFERTEKALRDRDKNFNILASVMQAWSTLVSPEAEADEDFVAVVDADLDVLDQVSDRDDEIPIAAQVLEDSAEGSIEETCLIHVPILERKAD